MYINKESLFGNVKSKFILIEDTVEANGVKLLKTIVKLFCKENIDIQFIQYESLNRDLFIQSGTSNKIIKFDAVSDSRGWINPDKSTSSLRSLDVFVKHVAGFKGVICIDSLSPLLFHNEASSVYRTFHRVLKENVDLQLIAVLHADVHDSYENEILERLASTALVVAPYEDTLSTTVRYSSGKVSNQLVEYKISEDFEFSLLRDINPQVKSLPVKQPDPTANLTFNLKLKDNEKEARSQLKLPYMQVQDSSIMELESDMYDEEDPDDDLDI